MSVLWLGHPPWGITWFQSLASQGVKTLSTLAIMSI